jgi:hypothetical protein
MPTETRDVTIACTTQRADPAHITQAEHDGVLALLRAVDWGRVQNKNRTNVIPDGASYCHSFIFGPNMKAGGAPAVNSLRYPILDRALRGLIAAFDPAFGYTNITVSHRWRLSLTAIPVIFCRNEDSVPRVHSCTLSSARGQVNKNLPCKPHRDTGNVGNSLIIGFGAYTGGRLALEAHDGSPGCAVEYDVARRFVRFDGARRTHWTLPFEGERYTAVFYTHRDGGPAASAPAAQAPPAA